VSSLNIRLEFELIEHVLPKCQVSHDNSPFETKTNCIPKSGGPLRKVKSGKRPAASRRLTSFEGGMVIARMPK
jgi:hypothetical protein